MAYMKNWNKTSLKDNYSWKKELDRLNGGLCPTYLGQSRRPSKLDRTKQECHRIFDYKTDMVIFQMQCIMSIRVQVILSKIVGS